MTKENAIIYKRLFKRLLPFRMKLAAVFLIMLVSTGINFILPLTNKFVVDNGLLKKDLRAVIIYSIAGLLLVIIDNLLNILTTRIMSYINNMYTYKWTSLCMRKLMRLKQDYLNTTNFTEIINNYRMDVMNVAFVTDEAFAFRIFSIFKVFGGLVGLLYIDYRLAVFVLILIPGKYVMTNYFTKLRKNNQKNYMEQAKEYSGWYGDKMGGIKEIKLAGIENAIMRQFSALQRKLVKTDINAQMIGTVNMSSESIFIETTGKIIYIAGAALIISGNFTIGGLFAFATYSVSVLARISSLFNIKYELARVVLSARRLFDFLDMEEEVDKVDSITLSKDTLQGNIRFENVSYAYSEDKEILKNISFEIKKGEKVGIVGLNGSGKTTLFNILLKLYEPKSGKVYLDGTDIKDYRRRDLRRAISVVSQDAYLFNATIKDNITLFSKPNLEKLKEAIHLSGASDLIDKLSNNIETKPGVSGNKLSGGEKQRIALARAFAKAGRIIVLDEATSSFDLKYEKRLNDILLTALKENTIIMITHRPYILRELDKIIVLDKGSISSIGTHEELLGKCELYSEILCQYSNLTG